MKIYHTGQAGSAGTPDSIRAVLRTQSAKLYRFVKRSVDLIVSGLALLILLPVLPLMAMIIRMDSRGPALFSQIRVGQFGREFRCLKLRSMYVDAEKRKLELEQQNEMAGGVIFKMKEDPRITPVGRFIRRTSIDELPQLWNVFIGDMSLVGPRPAIPDEVTRYSPYERCRLTVKPGITCLWQISGRSDLPFDKQVQLDVKYARNPSLLRDIKILFLTLPAVLLGRGAY